MAWECRVVLSFIRPSGNLITTPRLYRGTLMSVLTAHYRCLMYASSNINSRDERHNSSHSSNAQVNVMWSKYWKRLITSSQWAVVLIGYSVPFHEANPGTVPCFLSVSPLISKFITSSTFTGRGRWSLYAFSFRHPVASKLLLVSTLD